jgi:hypothetical protein
MHGTFFVYDHIQTPGDVKTVALKAIDGSCSIMIAKALPKEILFISEQRVWSHN